MSDVTIARLSAIAARHWGLFTTSEAVAAGVSHKQLTRLAHNHVIDRVLHGVYRMAGAPPVQHERTCAVWLAVGGADEWASQVPPVVSAGSTAARLHQIGDLYEDGHQFIVPARRGTRVVDVRFRIRHLEEDEFTFVDQLPVLTVERTIADLVDEATDLSLVADTLRDASEQGKLLWPGKVREFLERQPGHHAKAEGITDALFELAGVERAGIGQ